MKFTPLELRELGELRDVDMILYDEDFDYDEQSKAAVASNKQVMVIDRVLQQWRQREVGQASRRLHLHFYAKPLEVVGDEHGNVARLPVRAHRARRRGRRARHRRDPRGADRRRSTAPSATSDRRSPASRSTRKHGVIPNHEGQVLRKGDNERMYGVYATGWIKRGPVGLIGHTKSDAMETIKHVINDQGNWWAPADPVRGIVENLLRERGVEYTNLDGWHNLDRTSWRSARARSRPHQGRAARRDGARVERRGRVSASGPAA